MSRNQDVFNEHFLREPGRRRHLRLDRRPVLEGQRRQRFLPGDELRMRRRHERGMVLLAVLFFVLLASAGVATFLSHAVVDGMAAGNRDAAARAEALARGGVRLAIAALLQDVIQEKEGSSRRHQPRTCGRDSARCPSRSTTAACSRSRSRTPGGASVSTRCSRRARRGDEKSEIFLVELLTKVIEEIPVRPEQKLYEVEELARNLIDWVDVDEMRVSGGDENDFYAAQDPPYRAANLPLLSLDELLLIEGFDAQLVNALRPYVDVLPIANADGVNPNTAPSWVLALLYHGQPGAERARRRRHRATHPRHPRAERHPVRRRGEQPRLHAVARGRGG